MGINIQKVREAREQGKKGDAAAPAPPDKSAGEAIVLAFLSFVGNQAQKHKMDPARVRALVRDALDDWDD